jgi:hypothetical protein
MSGGGRGAPPVAFRAAVASARPDEAGADPFRAGGPNRASPRSCL